MVEAPQRSTPFSYEAASGIATPLSAVVPSERILSMEMAPDNLHVAYVVLSSTARNHLYVADLPFGASTLVTANLGTAPSPYAWSFDGTRLAYIAADDASSREDAYSVAPDASARRKLSGALLTDGGKVQSLTWSPTGDRIAFRASASPGAPPELYTVSGVGFGLVPVNFSPSVASEVTRFVWAPDGSALALVADYGAAGVPKLYVVDATASMPVVLSGVEEHVLDAAWTPDALRVAFLSSPQTSVIDESEA